MLLNHADIVTRIAALLKKTESRVTGVLIGFGTKDI